MEAHIFVAFLVYAPSVTLKQRLAALAPGLTPRAVLEKLATLQMLDVCLPTTDGRWLIMPRYTQPEPDQSLMLHQLALGLFGDGTQLWACQAPGMKCRIRRKHREETRAAAGMVNTQAQIIFVATPQCTAEKRCTLPTPIIPPAIV